MKPYPEDIISSPAKVYTNPNDDALFIRAVDKITTDDIQDNELVPKFVEKILAPNGNKELYSLSVSLKGEFIGAYVVFWPRNDYAQKNWDFKESVDKDKIEYSIETKDPVFIKNGIIKGHFPVRTETQQKTFEKEYCCRFIYKPTNCNFWHHELKIFENGIEVPLKYKGNTETRNVAQKIAEDLLLFVDEDKTIPRNLRT